MKVYLLVIFLLFTTNYGFSENLDNSLRLLGEKLFFDKRLSFNRTKSCASCHDPKLFFTDGYRKSIGATGDLHMRNSPSLFNVIDQKFLTAADPNITVLEEQIKLPLFNLKVIELGVSLKKQEILNEIKNDMQYIKLNPKITWNTIIKALAEFCRTLVSKNSKYDLFTNGNKEVFSKSEKKGMELFFSKKLNCTKCHGGKNFNTPNDNNYFQKNGFFKLEKRNVKVKHEIDFGLFNITKKERDKGKFKIPSLRNVAMTAPYMHDGSIASLNQVLLGYSSNMKLNLSNEDRYNLILFLNSLTELR